MFSKHKTFRFFLNLTFLILIHHNLRNVDGSPHEKRLLHHLLDKYQYLERPVAIDSDILHVKLGVNLMRLVRVDTTEMIVITNAWFEWEWNDRNLVWDPSEFGNISDVRIPPNQIWVPDIHLYNQVGHIFDTLHPTLAVIKSNGTVTYIPPGIFTTTCPFKLDDYPFDEHKCPMKLGSWAYDGNQVNLEISKTGGDVSNFVKNPEWELLGLPMTRNSTFYQCCPEPYVSVTGMLHIRRRGSHILSSAHVINFGICTLIFISALLPSSTSHKISLAIIAVVLSTYASKLYNPRPVPAEDTPRLVLYFEKLMVVGFISLMGNAFIFYLYSRKGAMHSKVKSIMMDNVLPLLKPICPIRNIPSKATQLSSRSTHGEINETAGITSDVHELISQVESLKEAVLDKQEYTNEVINDWNYLAIVIDRVLFIFWTIFIIMFATVAFPSFQYDQSD